MIEFSADMLEASGRATGPLGELGEREREYVLERYRKFLALAKRYPKERLVPTADIDAMWHLHMLMPHAYAQDCTAYSATSSTITAGLDVPRPKPKN